MKPEKDASLILESLYPKPKALLRNFSPQKGFSWYIMCTEQRKRPCKPSFQDDFPLFKCKDFAVKPQKKPCTFPSSIKILEGKKSGAPLKEGGDVEMLTGVGLRYGWSYGKLPPAVCFGCGGRLWLVLLVEGLFDLRPRIVTKNSRHPQRGIGNFGAADRGRIGTLLRRGILSRCVGVESTISEWSFVT